MKANEPGKCKLVQGHWLRAKDAYLHSDPRTGSGLSTERTLYTVSAVPPLRVITAQEPAEKPVTSACFSARDGGVEG